MEIHDKHEQKYYEVWLTKSEQSEVDRNILTKRLLTQKATKSIKSCSLCQGTMIFTDVLKAYC